MDSEKQPSNRDEVTKPAAADQNDTHPPAAEQTIQEPEIPQPAPPNLVATQANLSPPDDTGRSSDDGQAETLVDAAPAGGEEDSKTLYRSIMQFSTRLSDSEMMSGDDASTMTQNGEELAKSLIDKKKLTQFQLDQLRQGRGESLLLGNYILLEKIGVGGMGVVFKARHRRMKRDVAVKVLPEALMRSSESLARFHREVEMAAKLNHPNIAAAFDADEADGLHFLVMEYVAGPNLSRYVKDHGPLPLCYAVALSIQAAHGLKQAHDLDIIHRDIKPGNLLVNQEGTLKILDMGLAHVLATADGSATATELTQSGRVMGTVDYMAPEQAKDAKRADRRADVYSLGCTLYYLATGKPLSPKGSLTEKLLWHQNAKKPLLSANCPPSTEKLDAVVAKMLAKAPEDRQQSMEEVIVGLGECLREISDGEDRPTITGPLAAIPISENPISGSSISHFATKIASTVIQEMPQGPPRKGIGKIAAAAALLAVVLLGVFVAPKIFDNNSPVVRNPPKVKGEDGGMPQVDETGGPPTNQQPEIPDNHNRIVSQLNDQVAWIFACKGELSVITQGGLERHAVTSGDELPGVSYTVLGVKLTGDLVGDGDIEKLSEITGLEQLDLSDSKVTDKGLSVLRELPNLWQLKLGGTKISDKGMNHVASLAQLRDLTLDKSMISDAALATISGLPVLENIFLADTAITDNGVLQLTHLKNLRHVSLFGTNVTINGMFLLQSALPKLDVRWDGKDLEPRAARDLIALGAEISLQTTVDDNLLKVANPGDLPQGHFRIKIVDLSGNPKVDNRDLEPLTSLAHVVEIRLDGTSVTNDGVAGLAEIKSLRKIDLGALQIAPGPIALIKQQLPGIAIVEKQTDLWKTANWVLAQRGNVTVRLPDGRELSGIVDPLQLPKGEFTLTEIHLVDNPQIVDADLENVRGISQLKVLNISGSGVTDRGIVHVIGCTQLRDLDLSRTKITDVAASLLARIQSLRQLYVAGTDISGDGLEHLKSVGELTHLSLAKTKIQDDDLLWLKGLQNLRWLSLSGTGITDAARSSFDKLKTLKELHVDGSHITDAGLEELRRRIPHCETIVGDEPDKQRSALVWVVTREGVGVIAGKDGDVEIRDRAQLPRDACRLLSIDLRGVDVMGGAEGLNFLDGCTDLKILDLTDTEVGSRAFSAVGDLSSLTHLFLADTPVLERGLEPLSRLGNLEVLDLSGRRISGVGLGFLDGLTELRGLELENCQLTNEALSDLGRHGGLESLTLNKNLLISDQAVAQLSGLKNLKSLELANTSVTDAALEHIAGFKKLQVLNLAGATKIADADGLLGRLPAIRWIRLRGTKVGDATLKALESSKSVTYVDVVGTEVSEAAVTELKKANPRIQILNGKDKPKPQELPPDAQQPRQVPVRGGLFD